MLDQLKEILKSVNQDSEIFQLVAAQYRAMFLALVAKGFSEEQAMEILARQGGITVNK